MLSKVSQHCIHAEPNYGVLWFYFKNSVLDNAVDIWQNARVSISKEVEANKEAYKKAGTIAASKAEFWLGSQELISIFRTGMKNCLTDQKLKIVCGFEQILPQIAYL